MGIEKYINNVKKILVVGLGYRTGLQSANFLFKKGFEVEVCDMKDENSLSETASKLEKGIRVHYANQNPSLLDNGYDLIVLSPGVPVKIDLIQSALRKNIDVISEVELSYYYMKGTWIAITGTDGKSTTTAMTAFVLQQLGFDAVEGGNIGIPLISLCETSEDSTIIIAELSSFQLETIHNYKPDVAIILNLSPDHLDRYDGMDDYFEAKMNITMNQTEKEYFILNKDSKRMVEAQNRIKPQILSFSLKDEDSDCYFKNNTLYMRINENSCELLNSDNMTIPGIHNIQNAAACAVLVKAYCDSKNLELDIAKLGKAICEFKGLEHRMEIFKKANGRTFINDSKATTVKAVEMAVNSLDKNAIFIVGGRGKGDDYSVLKDIMNGRVKAVVLIGETTGEFEKIFAEFNCKKASSMSEAVGVSYGMSDAGDKIILSPACASYDMFSNYEERGRVFKEEVEKMFAEKQSGL